MPTRTTSRTITRTGARVVAVSAIVALAGGLVACASGGAGATSLSRGDQRMLENAAGEAPVVAVMMTADWCSTCKTLEPRVQQAMTSMPYNSVAMVYADYTDRQSPAAEQTLADAGLTSLHESNGGKTGIVYLIDADTGAIVGEIRGTSMNAQQIYGALEAAVQAAS
ncbi:MAG: thioredoxin domain-containing protein [Phycisphaerales bacterium]